MDNDRKPRNSSRRSFVKSTGGLGMAMMGGMSILPACQSLNDKPHSPPFRLASETSGLFAAKKPVVYDYVIIGSGYGGSILSYRLAERDASRKIAVLERGDEYGHGGKAFPETAAALSASLLGPNKTDGLFDFHVNKEINVLVGRGVGGTSLINAGVFIRPVDKVFESERWPRLFRDNPRLLDEFFKPVAQSLQLAPQALDKSRDRVSAKAAKAARAAGFSFSAMDLAVNDHCVGCGGCYAGCNIGAKNTLDRNYLKWAKKKGVEIYKQAEVAYFSQEGDEFLVHFNHRPSAPLMEDAGHEADLPSIRTRNIILAAGTLGSTKILLNTQQHSTLKFSKHLGQGFSGNGDLVRMAKAGKSSKVTHILGFPASGPRKNTQEAPGPSIKSVMDNRHDVEDFRDGMVIVDSALPSAWLPRSINLLNVFKKTPIQSVLNHSQAYFAITHERLPRPGKIELVNGKLNIRWPELRDSPPYVHRVEQVMKTLAASNDMTLLEPGDDPISRFFVNFNPVAPHTTVHPLGGCAMADDVERGVVNTKGQVFNAEGGIIKGLYVADGSIIPGSLGCHPIWTISALAEFIAAQINAAS